MDLDGDGRDEMFFGRFTTNPELYTAYHWTPGGYTTLFSHNDPIESIGSAHFRNPGLTEMVELAPNDLRVRDASGTVIFRASTDLPGWTGVNRDMQVLDVNGDGIGDLLASDAGSVRMLHPIGLTAVTGLGDGRSLALLGNAPNPFHAGTAIRFVLPAASDVAIRVCDARGRLVRRLTDHLSAGTQEIHWDGRDEQGRDVPSGVLFYELTANAARRTGRMVRLGR
jgi:hypothetical protein